LVLGSLALPLLQSCASPLAPMANPASSGAAEALLAESVAAHGGAALAAITDLNVSYAGEWHALVGRLQPDLVDSGFRGRSEERLLLRAGLVGQAHTGPKGNKQVVRHMMPAPGDVRVWFNGEEAQDQARRDAAAMVVDDYSLFLLGPMLLAGSSRVAALELGAPETDCDVLRVRMHPGQGLSEADELAVFIRRQDRLMQKVRFTLNGLESTRGAVAEVETADHIAKHGVQWPTRFHERLLRPLLLGVHDWRLTGLDINRGWNAAAVSGMGFTGSAAAPASPIGVG
jgi:hypothetical protein